MKFSFKKVILLSSVIIMLFSNSSIAQFFLPNSSFTQFSATTSGAGGTWHGKVLVRKAPTGTGNITWFRNTLTQGMIPMDVLNSRIASFSGSFSKNIAGLSAAQSVANKLKNRPNQYTGPGYVIDDASDLTAHNLSLLADDVPRTFVFRGLVYCPHRLKIGSNKVIWIDGTVIYTGAMVPDTPPPFKEKEGGLFELVRSRSNRVKNVVFRGTKRSKIITWKKAPAIYAEQVEALTIQGINFYNCHNALSFHKGENIKVYDNFIYKDNYRAIHCKVIKSVDVVNNLVFRPKDDGIDLDAFTSYAKVRNNIFFGGGRFKIWIEIGSNHNLIKNNIGIHDPLLGANSGGMQENGSANRASHQTHHNRWEDNHVFYANDNNNYQSITMHASRRINRGTISFVNNYVWTERNNASRHNPKRLFTQLNDVKFLTKGFPLPSKVSKKRMPANIVKDALATTTQSSSTVTTNTENLENVKDVTLGIKAYPTPLGSSDQLHILYTLPKNTKRASIQLISLTGTVVANKILPTTNLDHNRIDLNLSDLNIVRGTYFLRIISDDQSSTLKIIY